MSKVSLDKNLGRHGSEEIERLGFFNVSTPIFEKKLIRRININGMWLSNERDIKEGFHWFFNSFRIIWR